MLACRGVRRFPLLVCLLALSVGTGDAGASPRTAGTLPTVEEAALAALRREELHHPVVRLAADTNGYITVAALTVAQPGTPGSLQDLEAYVGAALRVLFRDVPALDEVDVTSVARTTGTLDPNRGDVTFTAAASRQELLACSGGAGAVDLVRCLPRVWVHPLFHDPAARLVDLRRLQADRAREGVEGPGGPWRPLKSPTGLPDLRELADRLVGQLRGGVVGGKVYRGSPLRRAVALTFDDGPEPLYTPLLLDTLARLRLRATFFLVGRRVDQFPYFASAIARAGHELGNHSYSHRSLVRLPPEEVRRDLERAQQAVFRATGVRPRVFRPPGGRYDRTVVQVASQLGLLTVLWTDSPGDYEGLGSERLQTRLLSRVYSGAILLLHQGVGETVRVLPGVWQTLRRHGFSAGGVLDLLGR
ncbi:Bifunctional xylanase/deacetylase [bacterium HR31]|nr:Bifunctional xylanase/deacetylase [bacterium HR31]